MRPPSTSPTVTELLTLRNSSPTARASHVGAPGIEGLLVEALSRAVGPGVRVWRRTVVDSPTGRTFVPLVLEATGRRVAVIPDDAPNAGAAEEAAVLLVFGPFDAIYRVRRRALLSAVPTVAWEIASREPRLFDAESVAALRLCALPSSTQPLSTHSMSIRPGRSTGSESAADREPWARVRPPAMSDIRIMHMKNPADWADSFERAMRSVEAARMPLFARSA